MKRSLQLTSDPKTVCVKKHSAFKRFVYRLPLAVYRMIIPAFIFFLFFTSNLRSQCTEFFGDPIPVPEIQPCGPECGQPVPIPGFFTQASAFLFQGLVAGNSYELDLCVANLGLPGQAFELTVINQFGDIINSVNNCAIQFTAPEDGDYLIIFNVVEQCGQPGSVAGEFFTVQLLCPAPCPCSYQRDVMVDLLLDPFLGILPDFNPVFSSLWSPFVDFGFGPGFEGVLPQGSVVTTPLDDNPIQLNFDAYLFFINDLPLAAYEHPTRFLLVDPTDCTPSFDEGSLILIDQLWYPVVFLPGSTEPITFFDEGNYTSDPPGPFNPDGLIIGPFFDSNDIVLPPPPDPAPTEKKSAALIVTGSSDRGFRADIPRWKSDLRNNLGVDNDRIICPGDTAISVDSFCAAIDKLCMLEDISVIYIRISGHGSNNRGILFRNNELLTKEMLCEKMRKVAKKGVPIHLTLNNCHSGSFVDANNWNFPAGSTIIYGARSGRWTWGVNGYMREFPDGTTGPSVTGFTLPIAQEECQSDNTDSDNDGFANPDTNKDGEVDECEAFRWVQSQRPCYVRSFAPAEMIGSYVVNRYVVYPAGPPAGKMIDSMITYGGFPVGICGNDLIYPNPEPMIIKVGNFGSNMNFNVQNNSGGSKDRFCMVFKGNVSGGFGRAWNSNANDEISGTWSQPSDVSANYDAATDETTVCWSASGSSAGNAAWVHFGYVAPSGKQLRPVRQYWDNNGGDLNKGTPEFVNIPDSDKVPTTESDIYLEGTGSPLTVTTVNRGLASDGWGESVDYVIGYRVSPVAIELEDLTLGNPLVSSLAYNAVNAGTLPADSDFKFDIVIPEELEPGQSLILQVELSWGLNTNTTTQLIQWDPLQPAICRDDVTYEDGDAIPGQTNSSGQITLDGVVIDEGKKIFNASGGVVLLPGTELSTNSEDIRLFTFGCDGSQTPPLIPTEEIAETFFFDQTPDEQDDNELNISDESSFEVFPNPFRNNITVQYSLNKASSVYLSLYDFNGKEVLVLVDTQEQPEGVYNFNINTSNLPKGTYFSVLRMKDKQEQLKLIKVE